MKLRVFLTLAFSVLMAATVSAQVSWLDRPLNNWNNGNGIVPNAPRTLAPIEGSCRDQIRTPESLADRAVTRAGWQLFGAAHTYSPVTIVTAMAGVDGMCRPTEYNAFVFINNRFAGTLAPLAVSSRTDGAFGSIQLFKDSASAEFARYTANDPLCCPSQKSFVTYSFITGARGVVKADDVTTEQTCRDSGGVETTDNVVSGTVTYRQRSALPPTAVITVKIVDVSRADASATTITEQRIDTAGKQVPFSFDMAYDRSKIQERNRYAVQAEIRDGGRLLFITDTSYPVITQGNPRSVEITLVPVGGGGGGGGRQNVIRGTVSYLQRIALAPNSEVTVRLVDSADPNGAAAAETKVATGTRQVPIPFELQYEMRDINRQRNYEVWAEIRSDGKLRFKTETGKPVTLRGIQPENVELILTAASDAAEPITGRTISLSKFGTGSMQIEGRSSMFLIRGSVAVDTNGNATVTLSRIDGSTAFTGKLTYFDETTLRIAVEGSGDADASGEIQITYSGRSLRSVAATNLVLDGQNVTLRF